MSSKIATLDGFAKATFLTGKTYKHGSFKWMRHYILMGCPLIEFDPPTMRTNKSSEENNIINRSMITNPQGTYWQWLNSYSQIL